MTEGDWNKALRGDPDREVVVKGEVVMARYLVSDAISAYAKELARKDRKDKAARLRYIAGRISQGNVPSKKSLDGAFTDLAVVKKRLVDGKKLQEV